MKNESPDLIVSNYKGRPHRLAQVAMVKTLHVADRVIVATAAREPINARLSVRDRAAYDMTLKMYVHGLN